MRFSETDAQLNLRQSSDVHQSLVGIAPAGKFAVTCARGLVTGVLSHSVGTAPPGRRALGVAALPDRLRRGARDRAGAITCTRYASIAPITTIATILRRSPRGTERVTVVARADIVVSF